MSGVIPADVIDSVTQRLNVAEIMGRYVTLRRTGSKYVALCPFHNEKTPSMSVDVDKGLWYCFGCHEGGNIYQFVMRMEGLRFSEAVQKLAEEVGITVETSEAALQENSERQRALALLERAADFYQKTLLQSPAGQAGRAYMVERGISRDIAVKFRLGWAPDGGAALMKALSISGYKAEEAEKCGLLTRTSFGVGDLMRNRLVFPICNSQGKVLAFGGRCLGDGKPKYLNTPETPWYSKRHNLYGLSLARGSISQQDVSVLVEGYFDVISMHQVGITTAVASLGTALTAEQAALLRRYSPNAILMYDSDTAGEKATLRGNDVLEEAGMRALVASLPAGDDPDSLARRGLEGVQSVLEAAVGVVGFQMEKLLREIDITTPEGKEDFVKATLPFLKKIKDPARQDAYVRRLAYYSGVAETRLHWRLRGNRQPSGAVVRPMRMLSVEEQLLEACMSHPAFVAEVQQHLSLDDFSDKGLRPYFELLFNMEGLAERQNSLTLKELMAGAGDDDQVRLAEIMTHRDLPTTREDVIKMASSVRDKHLRERLEQLRRELIPALDAGEVGVDDPRFQEYNKLRRHFHGRS